MGAYLAFDGDFVGLEKRATVPEDCVKKPDLNLSADNSELTLAAA